MTSLPSVYPGMIWDGTTEYANVLPDDWPWLGASNQGRAVGLATRRQQTCGKGNGFG